LNLFAVIVSEYLQNTLSPFAIDPCIIPFTMGPAESG
jgi:hypothetical protein